MELNAKDNLLEYYAGNGPLYLMCMLAGIITGIFASAYRYLLHECNHLRIKYISSHNKGDIVYLFKIWLIFILIGFVVDYLYKKYPRTSGSGIPQVKGVILGTIKYTRWFGQLAAKFIGGLLGIGAGLSLGREGPSVQMGSYIAYGIAKIFKVDRVKQGYLISCGASAGLSGAFGAPLAGVLFCLEELHKFITGKLIICIFVSSIAADFVGRRIFGINTSFNIIAPYPRHVNPYLHFALYILFAIIIAFFAKLFTITLLKSQDLFNTKKLSRPIKVTLIMTLSFILCIFFPEVTGGGHSLAENLKTLYNEIGILVIIFIVKLLFTSLSYSTGFAGGIFLPMLVLGSVLGKIFALFLTNFGLIDPVYIPHFMVLGMVAYFVGVVKAPITGVVLILEMTGNFEHLLAFVTVAIVCFYTTTLLHVEPIYDILYDRMPKDDLKESHEVENLGKTLISVPVTTESELDGRKISEVDWGSEVLVVSVQKNGKEIIPKGNIKMQSGDIITILLPEVSLTEVKEKLIKKGYYEVH